MIIPAFGGFGSAGTPGGGGGSSPAAVDGIATSTSSVVTSFVADLPSGATSGNYQVLIAGTAFHSAVVDTPAGWTLIDSQDGPSTTLGLYVFERLLDGSTAAETDITLTSANGQAWAVIAIEAENTSGVNTVAKGLGSTATSHAGRSVTTTEANALVIEASCLRNNDSPSTTPGWDANPSNCALVVGYQTKATAGATTGLAFTTIDSESGGFAQITVELVA